MKKTMNIGLRMNCVCQQTATNALLQCSSWDHVVFGKTMLIKIQSKH